MNTRVKLSAFVITYNEIDHIAACIKSISFADEIVVVDAYSTDGTWEFLTAHPKVHAIQHPFENFTAQKSFALSKVSHPWVLCIDADERITETLCTEITATINQSETCEAYYFYRQFMMNGKPLKFSGLQTDKVYRLFKREAAFFDQERVVHENLIVQGTSCILKHKLIHHFYKDYTTYKNKMLRYGRLRGVEEHKKAIQPNGFHRYIKPLYKFLNHYIIRLGILDGKNGYIIAYLNALSVYERYREVRRLQNRTT
ncbi:MAG: glycosyltransferase family 2 protein [Bacteroidota bacterium]